MNSKVDLFISQSIQWKKSYEILRSYALSFDVKEELKWGVPCYTVNNKNVFLIHGFKEYCSILFMKGVLMEDPHHHLIQQTENVQASRQLRFKSVDDINQMEEVIKSFISQAIEIEKSGLQVELKKETTLVYPVEFKSVLDENLKLKEAFDQLTPGRKRAYNLYFSAPKQQKTRKSRIEKMIPNILDGKGLND